MSLAIKIFFLLSLVTFIVPLNSSCVSPYHKKTSLSSNEHSTYDITYSENEIKVESPDMATSKSHFYYKNGEYYGSQDSTLFFSVVRDTVINITDEYGHKYRIEIEKMNNGQYKTSTYFINEVQGGIYFLISYVYDSKYHISKITKSEFVDYQ